MRALTIFAIPLVLTLAACGGGETTTVISTTTAEGTTTDVASDAPTPSDSTESAEDFCTTDEAIALKIADKKMMDASYGQLEATSGAPDQTKVEPLFNQVLELASAAPAGASCVAQPLYDAEGVAGSDFVPNGTARLKEVAKELQRHGFG